MPHIERRIQGTIRHQPRQAISGDIVKPSKVATYDQVPVRLQREGINWVVRTHRRFESCVERSRRHIRRFVIHDRENSRGRNAHTCVCGVAQSEKDRFIAFNQSVVKVCDNDVRANLTRGKNKGACRACLIVDSKGSRPSRDAEIHRHPPGNSVRAHDSNIYVRSVLTRKIERLAKRELTIGIVIVQDQ